MNYSECVEFINGVEAYDTQDRIVVADVYNLGGQIDIKDYEGKKVEMLVESIEQMESPVAAQAQRMPEQNEVPRQPSQAMVNVEAQIKKLPSGAQKARKEIEQAANELGAMISSAEKKFSSSVKKSDNQKLIMVHLSLQDQISELEKISMGLDSNSFNPGQIAIIKAEVGGVMANRGRPADDFQKSLMAVRDARLAEVSKKLGL